MYARYLQRRHRSALVRNVREASMSGPNQHARKILMPLWWQGFRMGLAIGAFPFVTLWATGKLVLS